MAAEAHTFELTDLRKLTIQQQNAIDLLILGSSDREAAEAVGVNRSTVTRWRLYHPAFQAELNAQRVSVWGTAKERLRALIPEAVDVVSQAIRDPANPDRARIAMDLLKTVNLSEGLASEGPTDPELIILKDVKPCTTLDLDIPDPYEINRRESHLQAQLNGVTDEELGELIEEAEEREEAEEKMRRKGARNSKKAARPRVEVLELLEPEVMPFLETGR